MSTLPTNPIANPFDFDAETIAREVDAGRLNAIEVVDAFHAVIASCNTELNALVRYTPEPARAQARAATLCSHPALLPAISIPAGKGRSGLPVGLQIIGRRSLRLDRSGRNRGRRGRLGPGSRDVKGGSLCAF